MRSHKHACIATIVLASALLGCVMEASCGVVPMMTEWGEKVTSENAWREYPRPQMVRKEWTCLNGDWDYAVTSVTNTSGRPEKWLGKIRVPFAPESALSGVGRLIEPDEFLWYTRKVVIHPKKGSRTLLHFDGVDFRAQVYIGHGEVTDVPHAGAHEPFTLDITDYVKDGDNELTVCVWDPTDDFIQSRGKQERKPSPCHYTRVSGIWQSVWTETVPAAYISDYSVATDIEAGEVSLKLSLSEDALKCASVRGRVRVSFGGVQVAEDTFGIDGECRVKLPLPLHLWTPESPALYSFDAMFGEDKVTGYFGMRSFAVGKDSKGILRFHLNGKPYFTIGTLDQGWWPDGLLTPPSEDAMRYDIEMIKRFGFNMMRKHMKVEPLRYYYLCDKIGILVFQDLPSCTSTWCKSPMVPDTVKCYGFQRHEMKAMMDVLGKVTSIVAWIPYNEGWGQPGEHLTHAMLDFVRRYDRSRIVGGPSGAWDWEGGHLLPRGWNWEERIETAHKPIGVCEASDMVDMHLYRGPAMFATNDRRASFLGEFGGLGHVVSNHVWKSAGKMWGYGGIGDTATLEGLEKAYLGLMGKLRELAANGLAGSVYTQTTDIEDEVNGLMTYDRKVLKFKPEVLRAAHSRVIAASNGTALMYRNSMSGTDKPVHFKRKE